MDINSFIDNFGAQFDDLGGVELKPDTKFRDIPDWSSLVGLSVIAMVDEEYDVQLRGDDVRSSNTIQELYDKVVAKKA